MSSLTIRPGAPKKETIIVGTRGGGGIRDNRGPKGHGGRPESKEREVGEKCTSITVFLYQCSKMREI